MFHITSIHFQHLHCIFVLMVSFVCLFVFEFYLIFRINFRVGGGAAWEMGAFAAPSQMKVVPTSYQEVL